MPRLDAARAASFVRGFAKARVAVLGDVMLDRYFWGDVDRISPEAPVPVVRVTRRSARLGGAANVAANLRALGASVDLCGILGDDREAEEFVELAGGLGVATEGLLAVAGRETTEKVRIIARSQQVVRADFESDVAPDDAVTRRLCDALVRLADACDALVISDYGKGVVTRSMLAEVIGAWRQAGRVVLVDPHVPHFEWYRGASVITPNTREASQATGIAFHAEPPPTREALDLVERMGLDALLVTRGEHGMSLYQAGGVEMHIPTVAREVYDVTGAGDTVIGVLAAALASGVGIEDGMVLANTAAGEVVKEVGTTTLSMEQFVAIFSGTAEDKS
jgi:D-beta-D-heptose 7-phosphate kinase/D-beta-D-heptose 1-phosphate adenosyltransferase